MAESLQAFLNEAVHTGVFPGVAVIAGNSNQVFETACAGRLSDATSAQVTPQTIYDVASLTKVMVTGVLMAQAVAEKRFQLDDKIAHHFLHLRHGFTLRQLLCHASGLPAWKPYYEKIDASLSREKVKQAYFEMINHEPLIARPGEKSEYCDLGFILLGFLLERMWNQDLQTLAQEKIFAPHGFQKTSYGPVSGPVAPTETCPFRKYTVSGEVHDLNAWALKGIAGHAGLFSTIEEVGRFAELALRNLQGETVFCAPEIFRQFGERQNIPSGATWGLAWDTPSPMRSTAGLYWSPRGVGHLGYTGCSLWIDPVRDFYVVCLSNRVHPSVENKKIQAFRPELHNHLVRAHFPEVKKVFISNHQRTIADDACIQSTKNIQMTAICGTGMGALAGLLKAKGLSVTGSDQQVYPPMSTQLEALGVALQNGYDGTRVDGKDLLIVGNAVSRGNPELETALETNVPVLSMSEALNRFFLKDMKPLVIAGTHGKTTTCALASWILHAGGKKPGFFVGGVLSNFNQSYQISSVSGAPFVVEGDEYDSACFDKRPKFAHFTPDVAIVTSIEYDHADIYPSLAAVKEAFASLIAHLRPESLLIACGEDENIRSLLPLCRAQIMLYGLDDTRFEWSASAIEEGPSGVDFDLLHTGHRVGRFHTPLLGRHNLKNLLAVLAAAARYGVSPAQAMDVMAGFKGVVRRQQVRGEVRGVKVIDDFAHHPTAVRVTLEALRHGYQGGRFWVVFEPRTATSRRKIFQEDYGRSFDLADEVIIASVFKPEGILPSERFSSEDLVNDLKGRGKQAVFMPDVESIVRYVVAKAAAGDHIIVLSNGGFGGIHDKLLQALHEKA